MPFWVSFSYTDDDEGVTESLFIQIIFIFSHVELPPRTTTASRAPFTSVSVSGGGKNLIIPQKGLFVSSSNTRDYFECRINMTSARLIRRRLLSPFIAIDSGWQCQHTCRRKSNLISWLKRFRWKLIRVSCKFPRFLLNACRSAWDPGWSSAQKGSEIRIWLIFK